MPTGRGVLAECKQSPYDFACLLAGRHPNRADETCVWPLRPGLSRPAWGYVLSTVRGASLGARVASPWLAPQELA
jgi:hypothetical protein